MRPGSVGHEQLEMLVITGPGQVSVPEHLLLVEPVVLPPSTPTEQYLAELSGRRVLTNTEAADHLIAALAELSVANRRGGLSRAPEQRRAEVATARGVRAEDVQRYATLDQAEALARGRLEFYAARGLGHLALTTAQTDLSPADRVARRDTEFAWQRFLAQNGGTGRTAAQHRQRLIQELRHQNDEVA